MTPWAGNLISNFQTKASPTPIKTTRSTQKKFQRIRKKIRGKKLKGKKLQGLPLH
jgi:hypothetical protein